MQSDTETKKTLGSAIDEIIAALEPLDDISRRTALRAVSDQLGISIATNFQQATQTPPAAEVRGKPEGPLPVKYQTTDIRSFANEKRPLNERERIALVAFYLSELAPFNERKDFIDKEDIKKYFKQASFPLPKRPEQALVNARHAGYLDPIGEGRYRLNPVGYNLVVHNLPRSKVEQNKGPRSSKRRQKSSKQKK